jgi:hypothetical protein
MAEDKRASTRRSSAPATDLPDVDGAEEGLVVSPPAALIGGDIDIQVATAKRYPRSIARFTKTALDMVTLDRAVAAQCFYALPARDHDTKKSIIGPSARFAELAASAWTNLRIEGRPIREEDRFIVSRGTAWDLECNVATAFEVRRRITTRNGARFGDDMIGVTGVAATSIAMRNAVLKAIPKPFWEPIWQAARKAAIGDAKTLAGRRADMVEYFGKMGIGAADVFAHLGVAGIQDVTLDHVEYLVGLATAIREGDRTIDDVFNAPTNGAGAGISGADLAEANKLFDALKLTAGARTAKIEEYKGRWGELIAWINAELDRELAASEAGGASTPAAGAPATNQPAAAPASTAAPAIAATSTAAPASNGRRAQGRFQI